MLQQDYLAVLEAKSVGELRDHVVKFAVGLGFERGAATTIVDRPFDDCECTSVHNVPEGYLNLVDDPEGRQCDPVSQHCKHSSVPIIWSQDTYVARGLGEKWEVQEVFGYATGIALALHLPRGRHFMFSVDRRDPLPRSPQALTRLVAEVQLYAVHAHEAAARLLQPAARAEEPPALTPRELECLRWTMEGKSAWEVGALLGITERTAAVHVNSAAHKLDCASKFHAVVKAMRMGLIR
jgi:DNA-binding CsgD family transcriptional regulator